MASTTPTTSAATVPVRPRPAVIVAAGLTKRYGDLVAVDGLDLAIGQGDIVAILGPNGAGKSTTIEMLLGLRTPTRGTIRVFAAEPNAKATRARVGAMLQESHAPETLTVAEAIDLVRHYYPVALGLDDILGRADLLDKRSSRVGQLSGGQQQRLNFALAIAGDPDLLFLDEPTAALDVSARLMFWEQVRGLAAQGKTILFSTHNLAEADALADRVVVISHGRIVADGTPRRSKLTVAARTVRLVTDVLADTIAAMPGVLTWTSWPASRSTPPTPLSSSRPRPPRICWLGSSPAAIGSRSSASPTPTWRPPSSISSAPEMPRPRRPPPLIAPPTPTPSWSPHHEVLN